MPAFLTLLSVLSSMLLVVGCGDDEDGGDRGAGATAAETTPTEEQQGAPAEAAPAVEGPGCRDVEAPEPRPDGGAERPRGSLDPGTTYEVVFETSCGDFSVRLDQETSPRTSASFVSLVRDRFFDGTTFHRIVPGFVIQGGDPTGTGTGGPGYSTRDTPPPGTAYTEGVVAMAKTATEPPGTAGSQFYVVTGADAQLPPDYAVLGEVVRGMDVVHAIGQLGDPASGGAGVPLQTVTVDKATVRER